MTSYSAFFKFIHLACALIIFFIIPLGFFMKGVNSENLLIELYDLHKSLGILILAIVLLRLYVRAKTVKPGDLTTHSKLERGLSQITHKSLYMLLLVMPVSGWLMSNAAGFSVSFFGLFGLPDLISKNDEALSLYQKIHYFAAVALVILIALHAAGALKHHFIDKDKTLKRMSSKSLGAVGGMFVALMTTLFLTSSIYFWVSSEGRQSTAHDSAHEASHESKHDSR